jgi:penicillin-binding protein 1A
LASGDKDLAIETDRFTPEVLGGARVEFGRGKSSRWSRDGVRPPGSAAPPTTGPDRPIDPPLTPRPPRRERASRPLLIGLALLCVAILIGVIALGVWALRGLPPLPATDALYTQTRAPAMSFRDPTGAVIATRGKQTGYRVKITELPDYVPHAFLAAEDKRFYAHGAIDLKGTLRAAATDLTHGSAVQGGSTISQQIAKTLFLKPEKTLKRKAQEAVLAWELENRLGKDGVLELYMNRVFYGQGAYGVDAAGQTYFGHPASQLTLQEAAFLAALPQAPSRLGHKDDLGAAMARSDAILDTMGEQGWITLGQLNQAKANRPRLAPPPPGDGAFGYVLDYAAAEATRIAGAGAPDLIVNLTLDPRLQAVAQDAVRQTIATEGKPAKASQAALVAMTPDGAIRAMVGGLDHTASPFNRATQAHRQPGSSFKPFVYATALEQGVKTSDVFQDAPLHLGGWNPTNYERGYRGSVTVQEALIHSINTVAVRVGMKIGPDKIANLAHRFGLAGIPDHPDLTISLGSKEVTLMQLVSGYQVFQNQGQRRTPYLIASITSTRGDPIFVHPPEPASPPAPVYDPDLAGKMVRMMMGVVERGTGTRASFGRPAAGKTGTSQDWRDAWFVGFTPDWAAGVWVGNDDYTPMEHVAGGTLPAAIWRRFMIEAHQTLPPRSFDWLPQLDAPVAAPPSETVVGADPRNNFYNDLANDFSNAAGGAD